jgi:hypothetical protein
MYINNPIVLELLTNDKIQGSSYAIKNTINLIFRQALRQKGEIAEKPFYP